MIGQIIGSLGGLAKSYIDAKTTVKITEAEIKKKQLTGEIDWEQSAIEASKDSWKRFSDYCGISEDYGSRLNRIRMTFPPYTVENFSHDAIEAVLSAPEELREEIVS